jgi:uncharacterized protein (TIGR02246 family)
MFNFVKHYALVALFCGSINFVSALEQKDELAIQKVIQFYTNSWNQHGGKDFASVYAENADFVNIYGVKFSGKDEIEARHIKILQTFLKDSKLEILDTSLREIQPGVVIASVRWRLEGYRSPSSDLNQPGETRDGIFTQVFVNSNNQWEITASQNTLKWQKK